MNLKYNLANANGRLIARRVKDRMSALVDKGTSFSQTKRDLKALGMGFYRDGLYTKKSLEIVFSLYFNKGARVDF